MTIIHILNHQTGELIGHLDSESDKFFWDAKHVHGLDGEHSQQFTMPADLEEAALLDGRTRFLIPLEDGGFEEFIQFESDTQMEDEKTVYGTPYYKEMDKKYILPPGEYAGTVENLANLVLPFVKHKLGVFEDIRDRTIIVDRHIGAYSFLEKISSEFDLEMQFRLTTAGSRVTGRFTDFLKRIGEDTRKEIVLGKDLLAINKKVHSERIVTGLFCIGPEREDGTRLTTTIFDEEAFQRWNEDGEHIIDIYEPESSDLEMTLAELEKYGRTELNKRIASVYEYTVTAASLEELFPHEKVRLGDRVRLKNPEFSPPLYADARVIRIERSLTDPDAKTYDIGEIVTYDEEEILKTFRKLQQQYNIRVVRSEEKPPGSPNKIWVQIVVDVNGVPTGMEVPHVWSTQLNDWVKVAPTTAAEIGAETPAGAQEKANDAEKAAKDHAEQRDTEQAQIINQTISQTRFDLETDLAAKAGLNYVDGKFSLIDSDLSAMLGDINLITGDVSGITSQVDGLQLTASDLQTRVAVNEDALLAGNGRMTTIETDVNELEGTISTTITQLMNLDGKVTNQQTQINANADAITLKASQTSLDTLTGEVSDINAELSVQAGQIALKASAKALTTVDNKVTGLQSDVSSLVVNVDGITSSVTSLRTDLNGLSIGGRNFLPNSGNFKTISGWNGSTLVQKDGFSTLFASGTGYPSTGNLQILEPNTEYIVTAEAMFGSDFPASNSIPNHIYVRKVVDNSSAIVGSFQLVGGNRTLLANKWEKISIKFKTIDTIEKLYFKFHLYGSSISVDKWLKNVKVEKGNKATDWTPAPEDVDLSISNVQQYASTVEQKANSIISNVTALTQTVNGHTTSISNAQSSITQLSNSVALKAEQTQVTSIAGEVTSVKNDVSTLKVDVTGITTNVSSLRSDLDGVQIGGRNLLPGTKDASGNLKTGYVTSSKFEGFNITEASFPSGSSTYIDIYTIKTIDVPVGEVYVLSFYAKASVPLNISCFFYSPNTTISSESNTGYKGSSTDGLASVALTTEWKRYWVRWKQTATLSTKNIIIGRLTANGTVSIAGAKLEKGNKNTDWTPAPEDTNAAIGAIGSRVTSAESSITQLSNSITLKAEQTTVNSLAGRMSSAESELTVQAGQISQKVSTSDYNGNKIASLINQTADTVLIQASKINLVGAVNVLSEISGELGNITAGTISGVTFTSVMGKKSFNLSNGLAEFIEDRSAAGVPLETRTAINEDGMKIQNSSYNEVDYTANLTAQVLSFAGYQGYQPTEYAADRIEMLQGSTSEFGIYPNASLATIQSTGPIELVAGAQKLTLFDNTLRYNGAPIGFSGSEILWSGALYMRDGQSVTPTRKLVDCPSGWILVWSRYVNGAAAGSDWNFTIVPKMFADIGGGSWHALPATGSGSVGVAPPVAYKYIYASSTQLLGHTRNDDGSESGQVLRYVLAF